MYPGYYPSYSYSRPRPLAALAPLLGAAGAGLAGALAAGAVFPSTAVVAQHAIRGQQP